MREPPYHRVVHGQRAIVGEKQRFEFVDGQTKSGNPILTPPHNVCVPVLSNIKTARSWLGQSLFMNGYQTCKSWYYSWTIFDKTLSPYIVLYHLTSLHLHLTSLHLHLTSVMPTTNYYLLQRLQIIICCDNCQLSSVMNNCE